MTNKDKKQVTVVIAGRPYPLKINQGDENAIRTIVKGINDKINELQLAYANKDQQDGLAMAILTYAVEMNKMKQTVQPLNDDELGKKLNHIDQSLAELLR